MGLALWTLSGKTVLPFSCL